MGEGRMPLCLSWDQDQGVRGAAGMKPPGCRGGYAMGAGSLQSVVGAAAVGTPGCSVQNQHAVGEPVGPAWACNGHATAAVCGRRLHHAVRAAAVWGALRVAVCHGYHLLGDQVWLNPGEQGCGVQCSGRMLLGLFSWDWAAQGVERESQSTGYMYTPHRSGRPRSNREAWQSSH